jgi:hypothetical protein
MAIRMTSREPLAQPAKIVRASAGSMLLPDAHNMIDITDALASGAMVVITGPAGGGGVDRPVGRPPSGKKTVTLRLDPDVIAKFKATGPGWQAKINDALKAVKV